MSAEIVRHPTAFTRTDMRPGETLGVASQYDWERVLVIGYCHDNTSLTVATSGMSRAEALWIIKQAERHVLGEMED